MLWRYNRRKNNSNPTIIQHTPADCWFSVMLFNPIRWGAQTITPLTLQQQQRLWNSNPLSKGYIHIMWACLRFQVQVCQPDVLIPKMDAPFRGNDKKRLKRSFTTGISCFPHFSLQPDWQLAEVRLFCWLLSSSTHIHLWRRRQLIKACVLRERLRARPHCCTHLFACPTTQCDYFGSLCQPCSEFSLAFFVPLLISTAVRELLRSTFTSAGCCLQAVFLPVPPIRWASGSIVPMGTARASVRISSTDLSGFPTPSASPHMAIKTENRPRCASVCP